ncbi:carbohydrate-binding family 9-like protein [candidate division KSB1 bacterium]|nr:carbohydrate-binding family 9-like protein [candidate division KSB1 bacterium]
MIVCLAACAVAPASPRSYLCYRATPNSPLRIDGVLDDGAWQFAEWTDSFVDIEGDLKPRPRFLTRVKMLWDDSCFYVGAQLEEPDIWATILKRDSIIFYDNDFEIFLDPDGDNHEYGEFEINALNTGWDLFLPKPYKDGGHADDAWNIDGIRTAVYVDGTLNGCGDECRGWSVEIAMPWSGLARCSHRSTAPNEGEQWRVNFSRVEWKKICEDGRYVKIAGLPEDNWVWSPQGVINMHRPEAWGIVQFTRQPFGTVHVKPDPFEKARGILQVVCDSQKEFLRVHQAWAPKLSALGIANWLDEVAPTTTMMLTKDGFVATLRVGVDDVGPVDAHINQDSHFWTEPVSK